MKKQANMDEGLMAELTIKKTYLKIEEKQDVKKIRPSILLHSCCGPCSTAVVERLSDAYDVTVFFYNPNITEQEEYEKRKETQISFLETYNQRKGARFRVSFLEGDYDPERFLQAVKGLEAEPEDGRRCDVCFWIRLEKTAELARCLGFSCFGTTLSVSPHKNTDRINQAGRALSGKYGVPFLAESFKKQGGFQRSIEMSKEYQLYRQNFCGCVFSRWQDDRNIIEKKQEENIE